MIEDILGSDPKNYTILQVALRALITYAFTVLIVKIGHKRFLGQTTVFDTVLGFILGSVMSRAINGQANFISTMAAGLFLIGIHWIAGWLGMRFKPFERLLKGEPHLLFHNNTLHDNELKKHLIGEEEIKQYMRDTANLDSFDDVKTATLERSGRISIVKKRQVPQTFDVEVKEGTTLVRIQLE